MRTRMIGSPIGQAIPSVQNPRCQWVFAREPNDNASTASTGYGEAGGTCEVKRFNTTREPWSCHAGSGSTRSRPSEATSPFQHGSVPPGACSEETNHQGRANFKII